MSTERTPYNSMTFGNSLAVRVDEEVKAMSISPSSRDVVLASRRGLFIVDLDDPFSLPRWLHHFSSWEIADVQWSPHASKPFWVASTSNQKAMLWNLALPSSNAIEHVLHGHTRAITDINFHPHDPLLLSTCSVDTFILNWDLRDPSKPCESFSDWFAGASQVKWSRVDPHILASSHEGRVHIWDRRKGSIPLKTIDGHARKINGINFSRTSASELMTCSLDGTVKLWDYNKYDFSVPNYTIECGFPVWRARYTPFGQGCAIMPLSAGNNSIYLTNFKDKKGVETLNPEHVFSGHTEPVHEFIWRSRGGYGGVGDSGDIKDNREFQLVTWSKDHDLRLWPISDLVLHSVHHEKDMKQWIEPASYLSPISQQSLLQKQHSLSVIKQKSGYTSYWAEPTDYALAMSRTTTITTANHRSISSPAAYMSRRCQKLETKDLHLRWLQGVRMGHKSEKDPNEDIFRQNIMGLNNGYSIDNLGEELGALTNKFPKVRFEKINVTVGHCAFSLVGPWGEADESIFVRFEISFPKNYPKDGNSPQFTIEENSCINDNQVNLIKQELDKLAQKFTSLDKVCLEPCLRYLLDNVTLDDYDFSESITSHSDYDSDYFSTDDEEISVDDSANIIGTISSLRSTNKYFQESTADDKNSIEYDDDSDDIDECEEDYIQDDSDNSESISYIGGCSKVPEHDNSPISGDKNPAKSIHGSGLTYNASKALHKPKVFLSSLIEPKPISHDTHKSNRSRFDSTPAPRLCGATWDNEGRLICFKRQIDIDKDVGSSTFYDVNKNRRNNRFGVSKFEIRLGPSVNYKYSHRPRHQTRSQLDNNGNTSVVYKATSSSEEDSSSSGYNGRSDEDNTHADRNSDDMSASDYYDSESEENLASNYKQSSRWMLKGQFKSPIRTKVPHNYLNLLLHDEPWFNQEVPIINTVSIHDFKTLIPTSKQLAVEYEIFGKTPEKLCQYNSEVAEMHGYQEIAECWKLLSIIVPGTVSIIKAASLAEQLNIDMPPVLGDINGPYLWGSHPFGRRWLIETMFDHFEKQHNTQMLAYMSCILSTNIHNNTELTIPALSTCVETSPLFDQTPNLPAYMRKSNINYPGDMNNDFSSIDYGNSYFPPMQMQIPFEAKFSHGEFFSTANTPLASSLHSNISASSIKMANAATRKSHLSNIPLKLKAFDHDAVRLKTHSYSSCISDNGSVGMIDYQNYVSFGNSRVNNGISNELSSGGRLHLTLPSGCLDFSHGDLNDFPKLPDRDLMLMPQLKVEMTNESLFGNHQVQSYVPLLDPSLESRFQSYRKQYASILYSWGLVTESLEILKFNYTTTASASAQDNCVIDGYLKLNDLYSAAIGLRLDSNLESLRFDKDHITCIAKHDTFVNHYKCQYCGLSVRSRFVVCMVCEHILHTACASDWWKSQETQCPSGCGCNCLLQDVNCNKL